MAPDDGGPMPLPGRTLLRQSDIDAVIGAVAQRRFLTTAQHIILSEIACAIGLTGGIALIDPACHPLTASAIRRAEGMTAIAQNARGSNMAQEFVATVTSARHAPWAKNDSLTDGSTFIVAASPERLAFMVDASAFGLNMKKLNVLDAGPATKQLLALLFSAQQNEVLHHRWDVPNAAGVSPHPEDDLHVAYPPRIAKLRACSGWLLLDIAAAYHTGERTKDIRDVCTTVRVSEKEATGYINAMRRSPQPPTSEVIARRALGFPPRGCRDAGNFNIAAGFPGDFGAARAIAKACAVVVAKLIEERKC